MAHGPNLHFLTVAEAARQLGVPGLKVRETAARGLIPSQRDNEDRLRVDLTGIDTLPEPGAAAASLDPATLMGLLFDEIEELQTGLAEKQSEIKALSDLVVRQGAAIERAEALLASPDQNAEGREAELTALLDRAMGLLEVQAAEGERNKQLQASADKAIELLARSLTLADDVQSRSDAQVKAMEMELETARKRLERTLSLSERAIDDAAEFARAAKGKERKKPGLWAKLFGR